MIDSLRDRVTGSGSAQVFEAVPEVSGQQIERVFDATGLVRTDVHRRIVEAALFWVQATTLGYVCPESLGYNMRMVQSFLEDVARGKEGTVPPSRWIPELFVWSGFVLRAKR